MAIFAFILNYEFSLRNPFAITKLTRESLNERGSDITSYEMLKWLEVSFPIPSREEKKGIFTRVALWRAPRPTTSVFYKVKKNIHPLFLVVNVIAIPFQISFSRPDDLVVTQSCHKTQTRSSLPCSLGPLRYAEVCFPTSKRLILHLKAKVSVQYYTRDKKNDWKSWL